MFPFFIFFGLALLWVAFICIPIMIANARGICGGEKATIAILSWFGLIFVVTWIVALILALVWRGDCKYSTDGLDNLDKLEQLSRLYKDKVITKVQYQEMKDRLVS